MGRPGALAETYTAHCASSGTPLVMAGTFRRQLDDRLGPGFDLGDARGQRDFGHYLRARWGRSGRVAPSGRARSTTIASVAVRCLRTCPDPNTPARHRCGRQRRIPGSRSECRARVPAVHVLACDAGRTGAVISWAGRTCIFRCCPGRGLARASSRTLSPARQRDARWQPVVSGEGSRSAGEALSVVVIDKLPFAPPDDPVLSARIARMQAGRARTRSWITSCHGRRLRSSRARDADPRRNRPRGADDLRPASGQQTLRSETQLDSLPPMKRTARPGRGAGVLRTPGQRLESSRLGSRRRARHENLHFGWRRLHRLSPGAAAARARHARRRRREAGSDQPDQAL